MTGPQQSLQFLFAWGHPYVSGHEIMKQGVFKAYPVGFPQPDFKLVFFSTLVIGWVSYPQQNLNSRTHTQHTHNPTI